MSRSRHIGLEQGETAVHGRGRTPAERRAALEEELAVAYMAGDGQRVSELRAVLADLDFPDDGEPSPSPMILAPALLDDFCAFADAFGVAAVRLATGSVRRGRQA
jgi:hypothetical protein